MEKNKDIKFGHTVALCKHVTLMRLVIAIIVVLTELRAANNNRLDHHEVSRTRFLEETNALYFRSSRTILLHVRSESCIIRRNFVVHKTCKSAYGDL